MPDLISHVWGNGRPVVSERRGAKWLYRSQQKWLLLVVASLEIFRVGERRLSIPSGDQGAS